MSEVAIGAVLVALLFVALASGLEIALSLGLVGLVGLVWLKGWSVGLAVIGSVAWSNATSFSFVAVPLFLFMSAILLHSGIGRSLYSAVARWVGFLPGGLAIASIFACAIFAAVSGSSVATAATIGLIAIPEMERRGYHRPLIYGSLAAGGTLGILIPPSIPMIIYGVMTETSVGKLYIAGVIPGILIALLFSGYVIVAVSLRPHLAPRSAEDRSSLREKLRSLADVGPIVLLIVVLLWSMYAGVVTPTEAAGLGAAVSIVLALLMRALTWQKLLRAFYDTVHTTSMLMLIVVFASTFSHVVALLGVPAALFRTVEGFNLPPAMVFALIFLFLLAIAYALEELSVMIIMLPVLFPLVTGLGFDAVWFGIIMTIWLEIGFITPPVGINLFVIQGVARDSTMREISVGATPFVLLMAAAVVVLFIFPELALWLPGEVMR